MADTPVMTSGRLAPLPMEFYLPSPRVVARKLLGHFLVRATDQGLMSGVIVETEAYLHDDPACHAFGGPTPRNRSMFGPPGRAYVYFIYGMHECFNTVCGPAGRGEGVLIRALEATGGLELMQKRRMVSRPTELTNGPAKLCQALGISRSFDGVDLSREDSPVYVARNPDRSRWLRRLGPIHRTTRIGITKAAQAPLRFLLSRSEWVSPPSREGSSGGGR